MRQAFSTPITSRQTTLLTAGPRPSRAPTPLLIHACVLPPPCVFAPPMPPPPHRSPAYHTADLRPCHRCISTRSAAPPFLCPPPPLLLTAVLRPWRAPPPAAS